jgi:outer membrane scaffolding protein for murein synthesis (MipA/OmpV family)
MNHLVKRVLISTLLHLLMPAMAAAQENGGADASSVKATVDAMDSAGMDMPGHGSRDWDITAGAGAAVRPTFEGSDRSRVSPLPYIDVTYDDMISLGVNGLNAYWHKDNIRVGGGVTFDGGRKDSKGNGIFNEGDVRLKGLGNIDSTIGFKGFASYDLGLFNIGASVTKFTGTQNDGLLVDFGAELPYKLTNKLMVITHIGATWADDSYMKSFFGVTPVQAAHSRFKKFSAGAGVKDVGAGVNVRYDFDGHWFAGAIVDVKELTGDAAKSPISYSDTNETFLAFVGYHF